MYRGNYRRGPGFERRRARRLPLVVQLSVTRTETAADCSGRPTRARQASCPAGNASTESADRRARIVAYFAGQGDLRLRRLPPALARRRYQAVVHARRDARTDVRMRRNPAPDQRAMPQRALPGIRTGRGMRNRPAYARRAPRLRPSTGGQRIGASETVRDGDSGEAI